MNIEIFVKIVIIFSVFSVSHTQFTPPVSTENGAVIGLQTTVDNTTINVFKGIPFAKPPVGNLRFRRTEPALNWNATNYATNYGPACWQPGIQGVTVSSSLSEDCLYLNVWTPTLNTSANLPVMVWIYGGAFIFGAGNQGPLIINVYDMSYLAQKDVVVVSFNYRVGVFGFLYGNSSEAPGNAGLWDQVMALNWTRRNIANFGGNPNDITLFGESAGSISLSNLIVSNAAFGIRDWFNKAILLSGTGFVEFLTQNTEYAYKFARNYARNAYLDSCYDDNRWIDCLREKTPIELLVSELTNVLLNGNNVIPGVLQFTPIYNDYYSLIPFSPNSAVKQGYFRQDLRILMNHNEMEGELFTLLLDILNFLGGRYSFYVPNPIPITKSIVTNDVLSVLLKNYPLFNQQVVNAFVEPFTDLEVTLDPQPIRRSIAYAAGDYGLACPTVLFGAYIAKWQSFTGIVYQSRFTYQSPISPFSATIWSKATHSEDLLFLFGQPLNYGPVFNSNDKFISNKMMDLVTHFAKTGEVILLNPSVYNTWPPYSVSNGYVNASYVELNPDHTRLGRVYTDRYRGNDGYFPNNIYNCFNFWDQYFP